MRVHRIALFVLLAVGLFTAIAIAYPALAYGAGAHTTTGDGNAPNIISDFDETYETALKSPFQAVSQEIGDDNVCQFYRKLIREIGLDE